VTNTTAGAVGEWYYPDRNLVPRPSGTVVDFARFGYTHQVWLAKEYFNSTPPLGVYSCEVPDPLTGALHDASIILYQEGK